jgi:Xaa-Pro aminopeptidase
MPADSLTEQKLSQASQLLQQSTHHAWLLFVRETSVQNDPVLPFFLESGLTWQSAIVLGRNGERIAIVGTYDAPALQSTGQWTEVVTYVQNIREPLLQALDHCVEPGGTIAINYSETDNHADGLTLGMFNILESIVQGTRHQGNWRSAEALAVNLRSRKTSEETRRITEAVAQTLQLFEKIGSFAKVGMTERQVYDQVHHWVRERGLGWSWDPSGDPIVNSGPNSMIGHGLPSDTIVIEPGHIFHVDLGVTFQGYSSDLQRVWMVGEQIPEMCQNAFKAVHAAIEAGAKALTPGVAGWQVDAVARKTLVSHGYPEYLHAFGHQVGRVAHDGGALLGPRWERYGNAPDLPIEIGQIFTLELGITVPGHGYLGLEEMVQVKEHGLTWLAPRQEHFWIIAK